MTGEARDTTGEARRASVRAAVPWRALGSFALALLAYAAVHHGLVYEGFLPAVQAGLFVGLVAAFPAASALEGAAAAAAGALAGALVEAPLAPGPVPVIVAQAVVAAALTAYLARMAAESGALRRPLLVALGALLVAGNLWLTTATLGPSRVVLEGRTMWQFVTSVPEPGTPQPDQDFFIAVYDKLKRGTPYYDAFRQAYHENTGERFNADPPGLAAVREPLLFVVLAALPGDGRSIVWAMAALATVAAGAAFAVSRDLAEPSARLVAAAAVAAYLLYYTTMPYLVGFEPWGGALAVVCAGLFVASCASPDGSRRRGLMAGAAAVAVAAFALRELMAFLLLAGLAAAWFAPREQRRFDLAVWGGALLVAGVAYAAHAVQALRIVSPGAHMEIWAGQGSLGNVVLGVLHGGANLSASPGVLVALAVLGVVGAAVQPDPQRRAFALVAVCAPLLFFTYAWNGAIDVATGRHVNYWGSIVNPLLLAFAPSALLLLPGLRRAPADATEEPLDSAEPYARSAAG